MFARITSLRYWNSEHTEQTCEDVWGAHTPAGLFAVADGAGTTALAGAWATLLVQQFLRLPLLSIDPFEVEWWLRRVQDQFTQQVDDAAVSDWSLLQKLHQGSQATLATLRFVQSARSARAEALVFGDSCVLVGKPAEGMVEAFPLQTPADFDRPPICLPSSRQVFDRHFHLGQRKQLALVAGEVVLLATDAVARWVISRGNGRFQSVWAAFASLAGQTQASWAAFIDECRAREEMADDDCTALVLALEAEGSAGDEVGTTSGYAPEDIAPRKQAFADALARQDAEALAILLGDGAALGTAGVSLPEREVARIRSVADALAAVLFALREAVRSNMPEAFSTTRRVWEQHAVLLASEPCARFLLQTLREKGVIPSIAG